MKGIPFGVSQPQCQGIYDGAGYLVLQRKDVAERSIVSLCPQLSSGRGIHEVYIDADPTARPLNAALQDITHPEFLRDVPNFYWFVPVGERRIAGDYEQA